MFCESKYVDYVMFSTKDSAQNQNEKYICMVRVRLNKFLDMKHAVWV